MALKVLKLKKELSDKQAELRKLREAAAEFEKREAEIAESIEQAETDEDKKVVDDAIDDFETEKKANEEKADQLEKEIREIEGELTELEDKQDQEVPAEKTEVRKEVKVMETRKFYGMSFEERTAFFANEDVKSFIQRTRELMGQRRAVTGGELLVPAVVLPIIRENVLRYSKLYRHVNVQRVAGNARQTVMGAYPEAIWTEACGKLNELNVTLTGVEVDGYKVGGYIPVCNSLLADSDEELATAIIEALSAGIGFAIDKAILYGTGTKMPKGIVTALAANVTGNLVAVTGKTDLALFKAIIEAAGNARGVYSRGEMFWAMNEKTYTTLIANALSVNAAGAIVSGANAQMPGIGGDVEVLNFIPDNVIIGGFGDCYLLAERAGTAITQSEHVMFTEDQTVFKGVARYDGQPVVPGAFVAIGIGGTAPTADAVTFAPDEANAQG